MKLLNVTLLLMAGSILCSAFANTDSKQTYTYDLSQCFVMPANELTASQLRAANYVGDEWMLSLQNGKPWARLRDPKKDAVVSLPFKLKHRQEFAGEQSAIKTEYGWLVGFDEGEWGGSLWWFSLDGKRQAKISNDQVHGFVRTKNGLFAWSGLAHMVIDEGQILSLTRNTQGKWTATTFVDLHQDPLVLTPDAEDNLIVVTHTQLVSIDSNKQVTPLIEKAFWQGLYPCSIVQTPDKSLYIGMRRGVAHVYKHDNGYSVDWLLPDRALLKAKAPY